MRETELRERLDDLSAAVRDPDLVTRAWVDGRAGRRASRRRSAAVVLGVAASVALVAGLGSLAPAPTPPAAPSVSSSAAVAVTHTALGVIPTDVLPPSDRLADLPLYPDADLEAVALDRKIGWPPDQPPRPLSSVGPLDLPVRAVMLRKVGEGRYRPVLDVPETTPQWLEVDSVTVRSDADGVLPTLDDDWIGPDRRQVAVPTGRGIAVVDVRGASTETVAIADDVTSVGWLDDGTLVATGHRRWRVVGAPGARVAKPIAGPASSQPEVITWADGEGLQRRSYRGDGSLDATIDLPLSAQGGVHGSTTSNIEGWSAAAVWFGQDLAGSTGHDQGVYAVQVDGRPVPRLLTHPTDDGTAKGGLVPLGWGPRDHLYVLSSSQQGEVVLAWDVISGGVTYVGPLMVPTPPGAEPAVGDPVGRIAL